METTLLLDEMPSVYPRTHEQVLALYLEMQKMRKEIEELKQENKFLTEDLNCFVKGFNTERSANFQLRGENERLNKMLSVRPIQFRTIQKPTARRMLFPRTFFKVKKNKTN